MFLRTFSSVLLIGLLMGCPANGDPDSDGSTEGIIAQPSTEGSTDGSTSTDAGSSDGTGDGTTDGSTPTDAGSGDGSADGTTPTDAGSSDGSSDGADAGSSDGSSDGAGDCDTFQVQIQGLFENGTYSGRSGSVGNCTSCHTDPASGYSASYTAMRGSYELYEKVNSDDMPMGGISWSADDKAILQNWINCGRPW